MCLYRKNNSIIQLPLFCFARGVKNLDISWEDKGERYRVFSEKPLNGKAFDVYSALCFLIKEKEEIQIGAKDVCDVLQIPGNGKYSQDVRKQVRLISSTLYTFENCLVPGQNVTIPLLNIEEVQKGRKVFF